MTETQSTANINYVVKIESQATVEIRFFKFLLHSLKFCKCISFAVILNDDFLFISFNLSMECSCWNKLTQNFLAVYDCCTMHHICHNDCEWKTQLLSGAIPSLCGALSPMSTNRPCSLRTQWLWINYDTLACWRLFVSAKWDTQFV